jgi:hypothetical protein
MVQICTIMLVLIDKYMSVWDKHEVHTRIVNYPADISYQVVSKVDWKGSITSCIYKQCITLVNLLRCKKVDAKDMSLKSFINAGFFVLEDNGKDEIVIGTYQKITGGPVEDVDPPISALEFINFNRQGCYKLTWNIRVNPIDENNSQLYTESRILSTDPLTKKLFSIYWFIINKGSALTRIDLLRTFKKQIQAYTSQ